MKRLGRTTMHDLAIGSVVTPHQAVEAFAGADIQAVHDGPRDSEFLVDKQTRVRNFRLFVRAIVPQQPTGN